MSRRNAAVALGVCIAILTLIQYYYMSISQSSLSNLPNKDEEVGAILDLPVKNRLYYVARFGLGHRLSKLSAAYHLAHVLDLPEVELHWGSCKTGTLDVFHYLFGTHKLTLRTNITRQDHRDLQILVRNDVAGYYAGQSYKNAQIPIPKEYLTQHSPWKSKLLLDRLLFQDLLDRFTERTPEVSRFQESWQTHTVIGLHVRAGNGEQDHFASSGRSVINTPTFLSNLCLLLRKYVAEHIQGPVLLFLATDTERVISIVQRACQEDNTRTYPGIPVVTLPQTRVQAAQGVSYHAWDQGQDCFQGWQSSMMDMALLAHSNILVAGMRSTFTQILPRALVMGRGERFCEVQETGRTMTCWDDEDIWLFRRDHTTCSLDSTIADPVVHKLLIHLPDVEEPNVWVKKAKVFLGSGEQSSTFAYGERFDPKYRKSGQEFRENWTLAV